MDLGRVVTVACVDIREVTSHRIEVYVESLWFVIPGHTCRYLYQILTFEKCG